MINLSLIGNLTRDPEVRTLASGENVATFDVAVNRTVGGKPVAMYVRVSAWGKTGENCMKYLNKGSKVYVEGMPSVHAFAKKSGEPGAALELSANRVEFCSSASATNVPKTEGKPDEQGFDQVVEDEDELPF